MKIVILSDDFPPKSFGGAGIIAYNLAKKLLEKGNEVLVVTITDESHESGLSSFGALGVYKIYSKYDMRWRAYKSLYNKGVLVEVEKILKEFSPDVVHAHNIHTHLSYAVLKLAKEFSKAVFLTMHDVMSFHYGKLGAIVDDKGGVVLEKVTPFKQLVQYRFFYNPFRNILIKHYLKYTDKIFAVSDALKTALESNGVKPIETLHNGIDISEWQVDGEKIEQTKDKLQLNGKKVLFFGGRLSSAKGSMTTVEVLKKVSDNVQNTVLLVAGEQGKSSEEILHKAKEMGVEDRIVFTGWVSREEMKYVYRVSDVVLVLSRYLDPFPTVNLEAMASKKPIVGAVFGGTKEAVIDGLNGYIVDPSNVEVVVERVVDLINNTEKALQFGTSGYTRVVTEFNSDDWVNKTLLCYAGILKNK
ncbi:MAG: glycosyltransferase family 4 protein [Patescibacteria group bacterium]